MASSIFVLNAFLFILTLSTSVFTRQEDGQSSSSIPDYEIDEIAAPSSETETLPRPVTDDTDADAAVIAEDGNLTLSDYADKGGKIVDAEKGYWGNYQCGRPTISPLSTVGETGIQAGQSASFIVTEEEDNEERFSFERMSSATFDENENSEPTGDEDEGLPNEGWASDFSESGEDEASKVVGGKREPIEKFPWQVSIRFNKMHHLCGGNLIHPRFILTAAHCFRNYRNPRVLSIYFGKSMKAIGEEDEMIRQIDKIIIHGRYDKPIKNNNDIALLKLNKPIRFSPKALPICLPKEDAEMPVVPRCFVSGYGETKGSGDAEYLKAIQVDYINNRQCKAIGAKFRNKLTENMFCAGVLAGGKDSCLGDSGGPLVCDDRIEKPDVFTLYGIVSFGWGCAMRNSPGVYTKVAKYIPWIYRNMKR